MKIADLVLFHVIFQFALFIISFVFINIAGLFYSLYETMSIFGTMLIHVFPGTSLAGSPSSYGSMRPSLFFHSSSFMIPFWNKYALPPELNQWTSSNQLYLLLDGRFQSTMILSIITGTSVSYSTCLHSSRISGVFSRLLIELIFQLKIDMNRKQFSNYRPWHLNIFHFTFI